MKETDATNIVLFCLVLLGWGGGQHFVASKSSVRAYKRDLTFDIHHAAFIDII